MSGWVLVVLQALGVGWLVALTDALWRLRRVLEEVHKLTADTDKNSQSAGSLWRHE